eukprot:4274732-Amphidinium_carterae.1
MLLEQGLSIAKWSWQWTSVWCEVISIEVGESKHQSCWELVSILVALHLALGTWGTQFPIWLRGDNLSALVAIMKLQAKGTMLLVAGEMALLRAQHPMDLWISHLPAEHNHGLMQ